MAVAATPQAGQKEASASEITFTNVVDRWVYVFMAVLFIAIVFTGFIPESLSKIAAVGAGERPPFPLVLHFHAALMGSFLVLLLAQTVLAASGRLEFHRRLGIAAAMLAPALVVVGFVLVPTMYHQVWNGMQMAPPGAQAGMQELLRLLNNIMLAQIRVGVFFPIFILIAFLARKSDAGLHKRMMFLAIAPALAAAFDRMLWIPQTMPDSPLSTNLYVLLAVSPMFIWDLVRTRKVHTAYWIWLGFMVPSSILIHSLWGSSWWQATAPRLVGL